MRILIFGAGGQAKETIDLIEENTKGKIAGFIDKNHTTKFFGYKYLGQDKDVDLVIKKYKPTHFFVAIGDLKIRCKVHSLMIKKLKPLSIISKKSSVSKYAKLGSHIIIYPGVTISADVVFGDNVYVNSNVSVGHESIVGNHVNINPGAHIAGKVIIEDFCTIGIGASVREKIHIARNTIVGGGAMVVKNTKPNKTYAGVPAEILKNNEAN